MLTFLRKIRRSLIESGAAQKYLLYAIGEIALVVIGILIALQINNWNEGRKARILEKDILIEIKNTLQINSELLESHISWVHQLNQISDKVIALIENDIEYVPTYEQDFYFSFYSGTNIYLANDGYEGLKNAGFEIIQNSSLRKAIVHLFSVQYQQNAEFMNYIKEHFNSYESFLLQNFIAEEKRLVPLDFAILKNNPQFISIIKRMKERRNRVLVNLETSLEENEGVLLFINSELSQVK
jgi:hypothetical protein